MVITPLSLTIGRLVNVVSDMSEIGKVHDCWLVYRKKRSPISLTRIRSLLLLLLVRWRTRGDTWPFLSRSLFFRFAKKNIPMFILVTPMSRCWQHLICKNFPFEIERGSFLMRVKVVAWSKFDVRSLETRENLHRHVTRSFLLSTVVFFDQYWLD